MALTLIQQYELAYNDPVELRKKIETAAITYAGYLLGLQNSDVKFNGKIEVYDKMMALSKRVLLAKANNDTKIFFSIMQRWIASVKAELTWETLDVDITDYLITYHIESDVFLKISGVTGDDFYNPEA